MCSPPARFHMAPTGRFEDGQVDSRLTVAVGVAW